MVHLLIVNIPHVNLCISTLFHFFIVSDGCLYNNHLVSSSLNGSNGEFTGTDDHDCGKIGGPDNRSKLDKALFDSSNFSASASVDIIDPNRRDGRLRTSRARNQRSRVNKRESSVDSNVTTQSAVPIKAPLPIAPRQIPAKMSTSANFNGLSVELAHDSVLSTFQKTTEFLDHSLSIEHTLKMLQNDLNSNRSRVYAKLDEQLITTAFNNDPARINEQVLAIENQRTLLTRTREARNDIAALRNEEATILEFGRTGADKEKKKPFSTFVRYTPVQQDDLFINVDIWSRLIPRLNHEHPDRVFLETCKMPYQVYPLFMKIEKKSFLSRFGKLILSPFIRGHDHELYNMDKPGHQPIRRGLDNYQQPLEDFNKHLTADDKFLDEPKFLSKYDPKNYTRINSNYKIFGFECDMIRNLFEDENWLTMNGFNAYNNVVVHPFLLQQAFSLGIGCSSDVTNFNAAIRDLKVRWIEMLPPDTFHDTVSVAFQMTNSLYYRSQRSHVATKVQTIK